ncbi:hypothetical protein FUA23_00355 [Neolewinella aurantiaca]|uniref:Effector-associated domain-containing protein n=1 Tax=Neolewinella aurantiaca TaxID=2602767 RepID=A0A5C7FK19_9BACT|nr:hypothetical protein [Neolewinella aurantiaca]TXF91669.1 hypothetical protein FUA23_00355 [Neolewinella aurantiaca]
MNKSEKRRYLSLIAAEQIDETIDQLKAAIAPDHPEYKRVVQLEKRFRELGERIDLGTLNAEDVSRIRSRISGGLGDIVREYEPKTAAAAPTESKTDKPVFKLDLPEEKKEKPKLDLKTIGYHGELDYAGSPTKKEQTVNLLKAYGAAYHTAREAVKKAGMEMVSGDRDGGRIEAAIAPTGTGGYGEKILMWLTPLDGSTTRVHVVVDSQLPTLAFDFGRNKTKLGILVSYLR